MKSSHNTSTLGFISILAAIALPIAASAATTIPTPKRTVAPHISEALSNAAGEVRVLVDINEYGFVTAASVKDSTNSVLNKISLEAIHQWTFEPAVEDGVAVSSRAVQPFYFSKGAIVMESKKTPEDSYPVVKNSIKPEISGELVNITGEVVLQASLDSKGNVQEVTVKSSTHSELEDTAAAALKLWSFKPAIKSGETVASNIVIPFHFKGTGRENTIAAAEKYNSVDKAPVAIRQPTPELTGGLIKERGVAKLKLTVDEHGYVAGVDILESSNEALALAASEAALQWKFRPAIKEGIAVASQVIQPFSFNGGFLTADLPVDSMPEVKRSKMPELPKALVGVQGFVKVRLDLDSKGNVLNASCTKTSHDELIAPTVEAAKAWSFKPAIRDGEKVPSSVIVPFVFNERS